MPGGGGEFGGFDPRAAEKKAQEERVAAYEAWRRHGARKGIWTTQVAFRQMAAGQWIPVKSSNVSAIKWSPMDPSYTPSRPKEQAVDVFADSRLQLDTWKPYAYAERGHGSPTVRVRGVDVDARDTGRLRSMMTPREWVKFQQRMLGPVARRGVDTPVNSSWVRKLAPTAKGKKITEETAGILYVRYHDGRVYMYPAMALSEALDMYQSPSKGRHVWEALRWSGRPYQQISGPAVQYRMGEGH